MRVKWLEDILKTNYLLATTGKHLRTHQIDIIYKNFFSDDQKIRYHHKTQVPRLACHVCFTTQVDVSGMNRHYRDYHTDYKQRNPTKCPLCGTGFTQRYVKPEAFSMNFSSAYSLYLSFQWQCKATHEHP